MKKQKNHKKILFLMLKNRQFTHDSRITPNKTAKAGIYPLNAPEITPKTTPNTTHPIPPPHPVGAITDRPPTRSSRRTSNDPSPPVGTPIHLRTRRAGS